MRRSRMVSLVPLLAVVGPLAAHTAHAQVAIVTSARPAPSDYVSPGVLVSFGLGTRANIGLGAEVSFNRIYQDNFSGFGGFLNGVYYTGDDHARLTFGGQANYSLVGAEVGWGFTTPTASTPEIGASTGPAAGVFASFAFFMVAVRGTFAAFGDTRSSSLSIDLGLKAPLLVHGYRIRVGGS